ncbi:MAG: hypothetical protein K9M45_11780 [Kiritimatiellales bacterium]|nr:hypothetical protein [Kiritimatiellales bacterium]
MMKTGIKVLSTVAVVGIVCGSCVWAAQAGAGQGGFRGLPRVGMMVQRVRTWLAIDDAQAANIKAVLASHKDSLMQARDTSQEARTALVDTILSKGNDEQAVRQAWRDFSYKIENAVIAAAGTIADVKAELTPAQQERVAAAREHMLNLKAAKLDMWRDIGQPLPQGE